MVKQHHCSQKNSIKCKALVKNHGASSSTSSICNGNTTTTIAGEPVTKSRPILQHSVYNEQQPKNIPRNIFLKDADSIFKFDLTMYGQKKTVVVSQSSAEETFPGGCLWELGILLAKLFCSPRYSPIQPNSWNKVKVLELGAGVGLTGIVTGVLGARQVILTDLPVVIERITKNNIALNASHLKGVNNKLRVSAQSLTWGFANEEADALASLGGAFPDLLIAGDVSYQHKPGASSHFDALVNTVLNTSGTNTIFVFGHRVRMEASHDLLNGFLQHFDYIRDVVRAEDLDDRFASVAKHNISMHIMKRKAPAID
jgi:predicted nicotinamide N-methyase